MNGVYELLEYGIYKSKKAIAISTARFGYVVVRLINTKDFEVRIYNNVEDAIKATNDNTGITIDECTSEDIINTIRHIDEYGQNNFIMYNEDRTHIISIIISNNTCHFTEYIIHAKTNNPVFKAHYIYDINNTHDTELLIKIILTDTIIHNYKFN